jgi:hypothetical protein
VIPGRGDWQQLYEPDIETFIGSSLLLKDEHSLQLVVQAFAEIGLRDGKVREQVSKFVTKAFRQFLPHDGSSLLI